MFGKVVFWLTFFVTLGFAVFLLYENLPRSPIDLVYERQVDESRVLDYGDTPMFGQNLRFSYTDVSFHLSPFCSSQKVRRMKNAFLIFSEHFEVISFSEVSQKDLADIKVICSNEEISIGENLFTVGEGGPSKIINTSQFKIIEEGKISLYKESSSCNYPVVELHELLHVFGFDHTPNPKSIMYNVSECDQRITPDMVRIIKDLYAIEPLPDIVITDLNASKKGRYLDFNVTILNEGLIKSPSFKLAIVYKGSAFESFDIEELAVGHGRTIRATNIRLPSLRVEAVNFVVDHENAIPEFSESNNLIQMKVKR